jgi:hypothetical protein
MLHFLRSVAAGYTRSGSSGLVGDASVAQHALFGLLIGPLAAFRPLARLLGLCGHSHCYAKRLISASMLAFSCFSFRRFSTAFYSSQRSFSSSELLSFLLSLNTISLVNDIDVSHERHFFL